MNAAMKLLNCCEMMGYFTEYTMTYSTACAWETCLVGSFESNGKLSHTKTLYMCCVYSTSAVLGDTVHDIYLYYVHCVVRGNNVCSRGACVGACDVHEVCWGM